MTRLMNTMTLFSGLLLMMVLVSVRRAHIRVEYSVSWLIAGAILLILSLNHAFVQQLAEWMGVGDPPMAIVVIAAFIFLVVFYRFSIRISALKDANIALAQRLAILEFRQKLHHEEQETTD